MSNAIEHLHPDSNRGGNVEDKLKGAGGSYWNWVANEIQSAIDDPQPSVCHSEVMARMNGRIAAKLGSSCGT